MKRHYDETRLNVAFSFNLRRYSEGDGGADAAMEELMRDDDAADMVDDPLEAAVLRRATEEWVATPNRSRRGSEAEAGPGPGPEAGPGPAVEKDETTTWFNGAYLFDGEDDDMRAGAQREAEMRTTLRAAAAAERSSSGSARASQSQSGGTAGFAHVRRILTLPPDQRDDLWAVLQEAAPTDPAAYDDPNTWREARARLKRQGLAPEPFLLLKPPNASHKKCLR